MPEALDPNRIAEILTDHPYAPRRPLQVGYEENELAPTDLAAIITGMVPVLGDVLGLGADADMYMRDPESREFFNYVLSAAGLLPFVPSASQVKQGIKAYHGSPHDFDKFSTEQIGTGEGAQAYGHGLYFTETEDVARNYRDALGTQSIVSNLKKNDTIQSFPKGVTQKEVKERYLKWADNNKATADELDTSPDAKWFTSKSNENRKASQNDKYTRAVSDYFNDKIDRKALDAVAKEEGFKGRLYEVNIDVSPDELLDWDLPFDKQSKKVKNALASINPTTNAGVDVENWEAVLDNDLLDKTSLGPAPTGNDLYRSVAQQSENAENALSEKGIKGIRYADAFTRHKSPDKQSMNYVIFDDRLISISKKYGIAIPVAAALLAKQTGEDPDKMYQEDSSA